MKKLFPVILATSACLGLLTACGGGSTSAGSDTAGSGSTGETYELKFAARTPRDFRPPRPCTGLLTR